MSPASSYSQAFRLPIGRSAAFALFADPAYLDQLTPPWFRLRPLAPLPAQLEAGTEITYRLRWRGLPLRWTSRITDWRPLEFFAYEQDGGPYRFFRHEHLFRCVEAGTEICDRVSFRSPAGGRVGDWLLRAELRRIFAFRQRRATALFRDLQARAGMESELDRIPRTNASSSPIERPT